jgi:hypothetical protein
MQNSDLKKKKNDLSIKPGGDCLGVETSERQEGERTGCVCVCVCVCVCMWWGGIEYD